MKITPLDINKQEFKKVMRGYDPVEVDTFLEILGKQLEKLLLENREGEKRLIELETELKNYKAHESTLKQTLVNVQESSTKSRENSRREADLIKREAELTSAQMIEKASRDVQRLREETITLQTQKQSLISRLRHVLTSQMELLEVLELDDADIGKLKDRTKKVFSAAVKQKEAEDKPEPVQKIEEPDFEVRIKQGQASTDSGPDEESIDTESAEDSDKINSDLFKDVFGNDLDIEKFTK